MQTSENCEHGKSKVPDELGSAIGHKADANTRCANSMLDKASTCEGMLGLSGLRRSWARTIKRLSRKKHKRSSQTGLFRALCA